MEKLKQHFIRLSDFNIRKKLLFVYFLLLLLPILLIGSYLTINMRNIIIQRAINEAAKDAYRLTDRISELCDSVVSISDRIISDEDALAVLSKKYDNHYTVMMDYTRTSIPTELKLAANEIESIRLYTDNDTLLSAGSFVYANDSIEQLDWYQNACAHPGQITWEYLYDPILKQNRLCMYRRITLSKGKCAVIVVSIKNSYFRSLIADESFNTLMSVNAESVVLSTDAKLIGTLLDMPQTKTGAALPDGQVILHDTYLEEASVIIRSSFHPYRNSNDTFQLFVIFPMQAIVGEANNVLSFSLLLIAATLTACIVMILLYTKHFSQRVQILKHAMHKVVGGDFSISTRLHGKDELGDLHEDLNKIIESINILINEVYEQKIQKEQLIRKQNEAEFKILASQINPHFFFNTLEAVRMKALCTGQKEIAEIIRLLGKSMRHILEVGNDLVTLSTELDYIAGYLQIQKFRYQDKFSYSIECPEDFDLKSYTMLPLVLQPLVENAFIHGIENLKTHGIITVRIQPQTDKLVIVIEDNGAGIREKKLEELKKRMEKNEGSTSESIGLCNVHQRLRLYYGEEYGLTLDSRPDEGTRVTAVLPLKWEGNGIA